MKQGKQHNLRFLVYMIGSYSCGVMLFLLFAMVGCGPQSKSVATDTSTKPKAEKQKTAAGDDKDDEFEKPGMSVPISGAELADVKNLRNVCGTKSLGLTSYEVRCNSAVQDGDRAYVILSKDNIKKGISVVHNESPTVSEGSASVSCEKGTALGIVCQVEVTSASSEKVTVDFSATATNKNTGESSTATDSVNVGYSVAAYGFSSLTPYSRVNRHGDSGASLTEDNNKEAGVQNVSFDPLNLTTVYAKGVCAGEGYARVSTAGGIYDVTDGEMTLFAGHPNKANVNDYSHRLRFSLSPSSARSDGLTIECLKGGDMLVADAYRQRIVYIERKGAVTKIAGTGTAGFSGDNGPASSAQVSSPIGIAADKHGNVFFADAGNLRVRMISSDGTIKTVAGTGAGTHSGDNGPATSATFSDLNGIAVDGDGNIYVSGGHRIRKFTVGGNITTIAGDGTAGYAGDGSSSGIRLWSPADLSTTPNGDLLIADRSNNRIRKISKATGVITTIAGGGSSYTEGGVATAVSLVYPSGVAAIGENEFLIADTNASRVRKVDSNGIITTFAGGSASFTGDGGDATLARISSSKGSVTAPDGTIYIADTSNHRIRKVKDGIISTIAGNGTAGYSGDNGLATAAQVSSPNGMALDSAGNIYFADTGNSRVRKINISTGVISTIAGTNSPGPAVDGGVATSSTLNSPKDVDVDSQGRVYIADSGNNAIRVILANGTIKNTFVGSPAPSPTPGVFLAGEPSSVTVDRTASNTIITFGNYEVFSIVHDNAGVYVSKNHIAGNGAMGSLGNGGSASSAAVSPVSVTKDSNGVIYVAETASIRAISGGIIRSFFGGAVSQDCAAGTATNEATLDTLDQELQSTLASVCPGSILSIKAGACVNNQYRVTFTQSHGTPGNNVVAITRPCQ